MSLHACLRGGRWLGGRVGPPILAALLLAVSISTSAQDATPGATPAEWEKQKGKILLDTRTALVERQQEQAGRAHLDMTRKYF